MRIVYSTHNLNEDHRTQLMQCLSRFDANATEVSDWTSLSTEPTRPVVITTLDGLQDLDETVYQHVITLIPKGISRIGSAAKDLLRQRLRGPHSVLVAPRAAVIGEELGRILSMLSVPNDPTVPRYIEEPKMTGFRIVQSPKDKLLLVSSMFTAIASIGGELRRSTYRLLATSFSSAMDEWVLNGVFHANPSFQDMPPTTPFHLPFKEGVEGHWHCTDEALVFSVTDPFGRLTPLAFVTAMTKDHNHNPLNNDSLGIGLRFSFDQCQHMLVQVHPGKMTRITGFAKLRPHSALYQGRSYSVLVY